MLARSLLALGIVACGAAAPPPPAPTPPPAPVAPVATTTQAPAPVTMPETVGLLERPRALEKLFEAFARLEDKTATDDVRIVQLGDSHTAADWETGPVRRQLQTRFGDGGRGFVPIGLPWKAWSQEGLLTGDAGQWTTQLTRPRGSRHPSEDGVYGLSGIAMATRQPGARAWVHLTTPTSRVELDYLEQPGGGSFDLIVDGAHSKRIATRGEQKRAAYHVVDVTEPAQHRIEVRSVGDGEVRVLGLALDRVEQRGLVLDALGINGASITAPLSWLEPQWAEELKHRAPSLVIVAYGTNDAADIETPLETFESGLLEVLSRVKHALPSAACLVLGPPDRATDRKPPTTPPRLIETIARERRVAAQAGCAFFDRMAAMGGQGSMAKWGQKDHVHLSRDGYAHVATAFTTDLFRAYDGWRSKKPP